VSICSVLSWYHKITLIYLKVLKNWKSVHYIKSGETCHLNSHDSYVVQMNAPCNVLRLNSIIETV
jgi:hypothetical protein